MYIRTYIVTIHVGHVGLCSYLMLYAHDCHVLCVCILVCLNMDGTKETNYEA